MAIFLNIVNISKNLDNIHKKRQVKIKDINDLLQVKKTEKNWRCSNQTHQQKAMYWFWDI